MKQSFLANYVIVIMATSAIVTMISYLLLTWTNKTIPTELTSFFGSFSGGSIFSELFKRIGTKQEIQLKLLPIDYALMGLAFAMAIAVINYNALIWADREIPSQMVVAINSMTTIVVAGTTFRNSNTGNTDRLEKIDKKD